MDATLDWFGCATFRLTIGKVVIFLDADWLPGFSRAIDTRPIREEMARLSPTTELVETGYGAAYPLFRVCPGRQASGVREPKRPPVMSSPRYPQAVHDDAKLRTRK
jgi:hypothetical protein